MTKCEFKFSASLLKILLTKFLLPQNNPVGGPVISAGDLNEQSKIAHSEERR